MHMGMQPGAHVGLQPRGHCAGLQRFCASSAARLVCRNWHRAAESAGGLIVDACSSVGRIQREWQRACLQGLPWRSEICEAAAFCGRLAVVKWAREHGCP